MIHEGVVKFYDRIESDNQFIDLARSYGEIIFSKSGEVIKELHVLDSNDAAPNTLSSRYGKEGFPYHSDTAYWSVPARLVLLRAKSGDFSRCTYWLSFNDLFKGVSMSLLKRSSWLCDTGVKKHYTTLVFNIEGNVGFRYDPNCMSPANKAALEVYDIIQSRLKNDHGEKIEWIQDRVAVLPNWLVVHARGCSSAIKQDRVVQRIFIK